MIRGAIDHTHPNRIAGWVYSDTVSVRDRKVLAFLDEACVGAGRVDVFRQDLVDAGLGDGFLGFSFGITLPIVDDLPRVVVRMEGSDLMLLQRGAKVIANEVRSNQAEAPLVPLQTLSSLQWKRSRGWLSEEEYNMLKNLTQLGVCNRTLADTVTNNDAINTADLATGAKEVFDIYYMDQLEVQRREVPALSDLVGMLPSIVSPSDTDTVLAIWASAKSRIGVLEGSHQAATSADAGDGFIGATDYALAPDRLLFVHKRCKFEPRSPAPKDGFVVFSASPLRK